jgi:hypothetical protein
LTSPRINVFNQNQKIKILIKGILSRQAGDHGVNPFSVVLGHFLQPSKSLRHLKKMNRKELAIELDVWPWDVDDWLLLGCPAKKNRTEWEFDLGKVKIWLKTEKIKIKWIKPHHLPTRPLFDQRWFGGRCPICIDRGIPEEKAGRVYTLGEVLESGEWHLRRTGIPCGHSALLDYIEISNSSSGKVKEISDKPQFKGQWSLISEPRRGI